MYVYFISNNYVESVEVEREEVAPIIISRHAEQYTFFNFIISRKSIDIECQQVFATYFFK